ncbi:MAG TPA: class I SAM-dependent methyltransferase [Flavobacteriia bacterium]|nr:class I SAM-dependent methyltransferase [Flavobacteriia bacterium]
MTFINLKFSTFFSTIQEAPWYRQFLNPVINAIDKNRKLLDIGTGSGKLIQILSNEKEVECIGVDTSLDMLKEAKKKIQSPTVTLVHTKAGQNLPFKDADFDYISLCNVLFNLHPTASEHLLKEALRLVKKDGKILVLTPTGKGNFLTLTQQFLSAKNLSVYIWYYATKNRAGPWHKNNPLKQFAQENGLHYTRMITLKGFAQIETLQK